MNEHALVNTLPDGTLERIEVETKIVDGLFYLSITITLIRDGKPQAGQTTMVKLSEIMQRRLLEAIGHGISE